MAGREDLCLLFNNAATFPDVVVDLNGEKSLLLHRNILLQSDYFRTAFCSQWSEKGKQAAVATNSSNKDLQGHQITFIEGDTVELWTTALLCLYTHDYERHIKTSVNKAISLLRIYDRLLCDPAKTEVIKVVKKLATQYNFVDDDLDTLREIGIQYNSPELVAHAERQSRPKAFGMETITGLLMSCTSLEGLPAQKTWFELRKSGFIDDHAMRQAFVIAVTARKPKFASQILQELVFTQPDLLNVFVPEVVCNTEFLDESFEVLSSYVLDTYNTVLECMKTGVISTTHGLEWLFKWLKKQRSPENTAAVVGGFGGFGQPQVVLTNPEAASVISGFSDFIFNVYKHLPSDDRIFFFARVKATNIAVRHLSDVSLEHFERRLTISNTQTGSVTDSGPASPSGNTSSPIPGPAAETAVVNTPAVATQSTTQSTGTFSFGVPSTTAAGFGTGSVNAPTSNFGSFGFGSDASASGSAPSTFGTLTSAGVFGTTAPAGANSNFGQFSFGASAPIPAATQTFGTASSMGTGGFSFGTGTGGFSFGAPS
eukprot:Colp12_sorted_trinity150504_noHs@22738